MSQAIVLSERDEQVLDELYKWKILTSRQIHKLINPSLHIRSIRKRLARLTNLGLVEKYQQAYSQAYWWITHSGAEAIHKPINKISSRALTGMKNGHHLRVTEIGLHLHFTAQSNGHVLDQWETEQQHKYANKKHFTADAVFTYDTPNQTFIKILELDRGTEGLRTLRKKILAYHAWTLHQPEEGIYLWQTQYPGQHPPLLLFIFDCPNPKQRIKKLAQWTQHDNIWKNLDVTAVSLQDFKTDCLNKLVGYRLPTLQPTSVVPVDNMMKGKAA